MTGKLTLHAYEYPTVEWWIAITMNINFCVVRYISSPRKIWVTNLLLIVTLQCCFLFSVWFCICIVMCWKQSFSRFFTVICLLAYFSRVFHLHFCLLIPFFYLEQPASSFTYYFTEQLFTSLRLYHTSPSFDICVSGESIVYCHHVFPSLPIHPPASSAIYVREGCNSFGTATPTRKNSEARDSSRLSACSFLGVKSVSWDSPFRVELSKSAPRVKFYIHSFIYISGGRTG